MENNEVEIWKDILNYEGFYQISNLGNVKSLYRIIKWKNGIKEVNEKILKPGMSNTKYNVVRLCKNNIGKTHQIHSLVAVAFLNHNYQKTKLVVNHINGNILDNRLINLEIVTQRYNTMDGHLRKGKSSKYPGVQWVKNDKTWATKIWIGKCLHLGYYKDEFLASKYYEYAVIHKDKYNGNILEFRNFLDSLIKIQK